MTHIYILGTKKNHKVRLQKTQTAAISLLIQIMLVELLPELSLPNSLRLINIMLWVSPNEAVLFWMELYLSH